MNERITTRILCLIIVILSIVGVACNTQPADTGTANTEPLVKTTEPAKAPSDKGDTVVTDFMNAAAAGGMAEVELGTMAVAKAQNAEVKAFAQKMIDDHSKAGAELKQLATQKKVMLPPDVLPTHKEIMDKLSKLSGADFDREYVKAMVADHEKDVTAFTSVSKGATDADVKAFATKTLPTLEMHFEMIKSLADKMKIKMK